MFVARWPPCFLLSSLTNRSLVVSLFCASVCLILFYWLFLNMFIDVALYCYCYMRRLMEKMTRKMQFLERKFKIFIHLFVFLNLWFTIQKFSVLKGVKNWCVRENYLTLLKGPYWWFVMFMDVKLLTSISQNMLPRNAFWNCFSYFSFGRQLTVM